jgi:hypothetical protein
MDILERKPINSLSAEMKKIMKLLQYNKTKLELKGSASLASQKYPSDYDFMCTIHPDKDKFYDFLVELLEVIKGSTDKWFLELKLQTKAGKKCRVLPGGTLKREVYDKAFPTLDYAKLDLVAYVGEFVEVSVIYSVSETAQTQEEYIASLEKDIKDLKKDGLHYKILKRRFNIAKSKGDKKELLRLSKIFNGELGEQYQTLSRLQAIEKVLDFYQDPNTIKTALVALKDLHVPADTDNVEAYVASQSKALNAKAKKL